MKLIGAALPRTGTMSLVKALEELGLKCYHMKECAMNSFSGRGDLDKWQKISTMTPYSEERLELIRAIFDGYDACCDAPSCLVYQELSFIYPNVPVLLTMREPAAWRKSVAGSVYSAHKMFNSPFAPLCLLVFRGLNLLPIFKTFGVIGSLVKEEKIIMEGFSTEGGMLDFESDDDAHEIERRYSDWIAVVKKSIPGDRLHSIEPPYENAFKILCCALELPLPDKRYPHVNDRRDIKKAFGIFTAMFYAIPCITISAVSGILLVAFPFGAPLVALGCAGIFLLLIYGLQTLLTATVRTVGTRRSDAESDKG